MDDSANSLRMLHIFDAEGKFRHDMIAYYNGEILERPAPLRDSKTSTNANNTYVAQPPRIRGQRRAHQGPVPHMSQHTQSYDGPSTSQHIRTSCISVPDANNQTRDQMKRKHDVDSVQQPNKNCRTDQPNRGASVQCICNAPFDNGRFVVFCHICCRRYHGICMGLADDNAYKANGFVCTNCMPTQSEKDRLYCDCRRQFNKWKLFIICRKCRQWFHGTCLGLTKADAHGAYKYYECVRCNPRAAVHVVNRSALTRADLFDLKNFMREILKNEHAQPFIAPFITGLEFGLDIYMIENPMDLETIQSKLGSNRYANLLEFLRDMATIFENCRIYHDSTTDNYKHAKALERSFVTEVIMLRNRFLRRR